MSGASPAHPAPRAEDIVRRIERMTRLVRSATLFKSAPPLTPSLAPSGQPKAAVSPVAPGDSGNWWVLAQGRILDPANFAAREAAREDLLASVRGVGVLVEHNVWVWDETNRAQLVVATLPTRERALRVAERLRDKGLNIAVRPEKPEPES